MTIDYAALEKVCGPCYSRHEEEDWERVLQDRWFRHMVEWVANRNLWVQFERCDDYDLVIVEGTSRRYIGEGPTLLEALAAAVLKVGKEEHKETPPPPKGR